MTDTELLSMLAQYRMSIEFKGEFVVVRAEGQRLSGWHAIAGEPLDALRNAIAVESAVAAFQ